MSDSKAACPRHAAFSMRLQSQCSVEFGGEAVVVIVEQFVVGQARKGEVARLKGSKAQRSQGAKGPRGERGNV